MIILKIVSCYGSVLFFITFFSENVSCSDLPVMSDFHVPYFIFHSLIGAGWKGKCQHIHNMLTNLTLKEFLEG